MAGRRVRQVQVNATNIEIGADVDMITLRLNYRFGWGSSPVVAEY